MVHSQKKRYKKRSYKGTIQGLTLKVQKEGTKANLSLLGTGKDQFDISSGALLTVNNTNDKVMMYIY